MSNVLPIREFSESEIIKFRNKIIKGDDVNDCWGWLGAKGVNNYSIFKIKYERYRASRVSYFLEYGIDPENLDVCHTCDNPICINPKHLFLGTRLDNMKDASLKNRMCKGGDNIKSKLKESDIPKIKEIYSKGGISQLKLSKQFSVSQAIIARVISSKLWKHVNILNK